METEVDGCNKSIYDRKNGKPRNLRKNVLEVGENNVENMSMKQGINE